MANASLRGGSEGEQLGSYRLVRKLGRGGMGEVWLAEHETIKSQVAIKLVLAAPDDDDAASRFLREAKATARIRHPGVVTVTDFGPRANGGAYLVMELLEGETLADRLERGALPNDLAIDLGVQIAEALAAAHASGVVHRDLKPANIFLVRDGAARSDVRVKLVDFGVAKATGKVTDELGMTDTGALVGTPVYMAPEQCTSHRGPVDHRADLYALGVVLYQMLTGKPPFRGPTLGDLIEQHLNEIPVSPRVAVPGITAKLDVLIMTLLAKQQADRPQSANEIARVLHALRETTPSPLDETMASGARPPVKQVTQASVDETLASVDRTTAEPASQAQPALPKAAVTTIEATPRPVPKALIFGLAGGFVLFCVILVVIVMRRERLTPEAPPIPTDPGAACEQGDPSSCLSLYEREMKLDKPDLSRVATWLQTACNRDHQGACAKLASMYAWGAGVSADLDRALALATTACEKGDGNGCDLAGDFLPASPDRAKLAMAYFLRGCELGAAFPCLSAGRRMRFGQGMPMDPERAKKLLEKSFQLASKGCEANDPQDCRIMGIDLIRGDGVAPKPQEGFAKLQRACDLGSADACGEAGEQLALGTGGIQKDPERARKYLQMGCDRGGANACVTLGVAIAYGLVGTADNTKGFEMVKFACEKRSPRACSVLGNFYRTGVGTPKDMLLAMSVYKRGCDAGDSDACAQLAGMDKVAESDKEQLLQRACDLSSGIGCKTLGDRADKRGDFSRAFSMYELACASTDMQAGCSEVATAYIEGRGVPQDVARGRQLLETACKQQAQVSCHALGVRLRDGKGFKAEPVPALWAFDQACELGWGASCIAGAEMRENAVYGVTPDPKKAAELRKRACELEPSTCKAK